MAAIYLVDGRTVYADGTPVESTNPFYYNAAEDEARQRAEQMAFANDELARRQELNADAWERGERLPYPDAGFPPGYIPPGGSNIVPPMPVSANVSVNGGAPPDPRAALDFFTSVSPYVWYAAGALVLYALVSRGRRS